MPEHHDQRLQISLFSDSIVLISPDTGGESLTAIAEAAAYIMRNAIGSGIPMKGAPAQGVVTNDTDKQFFFELPIIDAYLLRENVKYYGVVVHHSAEQSGIGMPLFTDAPVYGCPCLRMPPHRCATPYRTSRASMSTTPWSSSAVYPARHRPQGERKGRIFRQIA